MSLFLMPAAPMPSCFELLPPDVYLYALDNMSHGHPNIHGSTPAPSNSQEFYAFQKLLRHLYRQSSLTLKHVERLRGYLHRIYTLRTTDGLLFTIKCAPSRETRLLRHEQRSLATEAKALELIRTRTQVPVPQRLSYDLSSTNNIGVAYVLRSHIQGAPLVDLLPYLSAADRSGIDRSLGTYLAALSQLQADSFGMMHRVTASSGHTTWGEAFRSLLESVLRDSEDMLVSLPYEIIRYHAGKHKRHLDEIKEPRLVALDAGTPQSVLLDNGTRQIVGLLGFANVAWGDPMLAGVFASASEAFWEGYGGKPVNDRGYQVRALL